MDVLRYDSYNKKGSDLEVVTSQWNDPQSQDVVVDCSNVGKGFTVGHMVHQVFEGLNLQIRRGTIFSLLGPSGCGKTTLLKCIVGRLLVDQGSLKVFGKQPQPGPMVGYMPQMIALLNDLTVRETLWLFGRIAQLDPKKTRIRIEFMLSVLGMSSHVDATFQKLSGGQQRRVAFAAALLNEAPLLILDEPTVGVDPILRQNIWTYLRSLVSRTNTTVIITTHYIEEARNSQMIGMLLEGRLLAVSTPDALLKECDCTSLEDAFLKLSLNDAIKHGYAGDVAMGPKLRSQRRYIRLNPFSLVNQFKQRLSRSYAESFSKVRLIELTKSNFLCYVRHPWALISSLFLPAFMFFILPYSFSGQLHGLKMATVNQDQGDFGMQLLGEIDNYIIDKVPCDSYEDGVEALRNGSVYGVLWLKSNFSTAMKYRFTMPVLVTDQIIADSTVFAALDYYNLPFIQTMVTQMTKAFQRFASSMAKIINLNPQILNTPIEFLPGVSEKVDLTDFNSFLLPGFILIVVFFVIAGNLCVINVSMAETGYYDRLYTTGVSSLEIILSQAGYQMLIVGPQLLFAFLVVFMVNGFQCHGSYTLLILLSVFSYFSGVFLGLLLSGLSSNLHMAMVLFVVVSMLCFILQGMVWPLDGMGDSLRNICAYGPFAYPSIALRNIMNKGWTLTHPTVFRGFATSIVWTIVTFYITWFTYWFKK